jgi:hypothetical protein
LREHGAATSAIAKHEIGSRLFLHRYGARSPAGVTASQNQAFGHFAAVQRPAIVASMPIIAFHPAHKAADDATPPRERYTAVEISPIAAEVLQQMVGPSGGFLSRQDVPVLERLAQSQARDTDLLLVSTLLESHEVVFVRLL